MTAAGAAIIRGVNLGGWLVLERYITPYLFALTTCDIKGNFYNYPNQIINSQTENSKNFKTYEFDSSFKYDYSNPTKTIWSTMECQPLEEYPVDQSTLLQAFSNPDIAREYLRRHWEHFVTREDLKTLSKSGITHLRIPIGHWIVGDKLDDEPYVNGEWQYLVQVCHWAREFHLEIWLDIHTAPGSQNGFDNSGMLKPEPTCLGWYSDKKNVQLSLDVVKHVLEATKRDGLEDVITGFGPLNEPWIDCDFSILKKFWNDALETTRKIIPSMKVYIGDSFNVNQFNNGTFWTNEEKYHDTYLDSHYYQVFTDLPRTLSPKQHIALVCQRNAKDTASCCFEDAPKNTIPSKGIHRIIGEWSVSFDTLPVAKLNDIMMSIRRTGKAPDINREIPLERQTFLKKFSQAQRIVFETYSQGWFFWNFKMEGGAFGEWDYLRGLKDNWVFADIDDLSCWDILDETEDSMSIVDIFPSKTKQEISTIQQNELTDDVVISHGKELQDAFHYYSLDEKQGENIMTQDVEEDKVSEEENKDIKIEEEDVGPTIDRDEAIGYDMNGKKYHTNQQEKVTQEKKHHSTFVIFLSFVLGAIAWVRLKQRFWRNDYDQIMELNV